LYSLLVVAMDEMISWDYQQSQKKEDFFESIRLIVKACNNTVWPVTVQCCNAVTA